MKSKNHIILWLLVIILFSITVIVFNDTLALFETNAQGIINNDIGKWVIKVNNETITSTENETIDINSFVYTSNPRVEDGYIAPGGNAYFDLTVDATECDVAVLYSIDLNLEDTGYAENISFTLDDSAHTVMRTGEFEYSGIIDLASINNGDTRTIRIYVTWNDLESYNESDTALGSVEDSLLTVPIKFHARQYLGETLVEYTG